MNPRYNIKVGDLCRLDEVNYPQYRGMVGIVKKAWRPDIVTCSKWFVYIDGRTHPYSIEEKFVEVKGECW